MTPSIAPAAPKYTFGDTWPALLTYDEERRDLFEAVREALRSGKPDRDRLAACFYLLRHLAGIAPRR